MGKNQKDKWTYNMLTCNCEHFARAMTEGKPRSTQQDALTELTENTFKKGRPLRGLANGFKQLNDCGDADLHRNAKVRHGQASASAGPFRAAANGPCAEADASLNNGPRAYAKLEACRAEADAGPVGVHAGLNCNTGAHIEDRSFGAALLGFGFAWGSGGLELNTPFGGLH